ncbi:MAG: hypothetical protein JWO03_3544 [Bacteroidetes bacterium]|nr:hypothetical protein [Bacteroidota bacterium]
MIFVIAASCCNAQDAGRVIMVKVYEAVYTNNCKPSIRIFKADNTIDVIDLDAKKNKVGSSEQDENDKKVREQLDKIVSQGYTLKGTSQSNDNEIVNVTTYIFEKK